MEYFRHFDTSNGFPSNNAIRTLKGIDQFLWIGCSQGLYKYDGLAFAKILPNAKHHNFEEVVVYHQDQLGWLYLGLTGAGLGKYHPESDSLIHFLHQQNDTTTIGSNTIDDLIEDDSGNIWMIAESNGFCKLDPINHQISRYDPSDFGFHKGLYRILKDPNNSDLLWILGKELFSFQISTEEMVAYPVPKNWGELNDIRSGYIDLNGNIFVGSWTKGMYIFNSFEKEWKNQNTQINKGDFSNISAIIEKDQQSLYIFETTKGLFTLNKDSLYAENIGPVFNRNESALWQESFKVKGNAAHFSYDKKLNAYWISSARNGLTLYYPSTFFKRYYFDLGVNKAQSHPTLPLIYLIGGGKKLLIYNEENKTVKTIPIDVIENDIGFRRIIIYEDGSCDLMGWRAIYHYDGVSDKANVLHSNHQGRGAEFLEMKKDENQLWIGSRKNGFFCIEENKKKHFIPKQWIFQDSVAFSYIKDLEFTNEYIWFCSHQGLFNLSKKTKEFFTYPSELKTDKGNIWNKIVSIELDHHGRLWLASVGNGLGYIYVNKPHPQQIIEFDATRLIDLRLNEMALDQDGHLWCLSEKGLTYINTSTFESKKFGEDFGFLQGKLFSLSSLNNGKMVVGTSRGIHMFDPLKVHQTLTPKPKINLVSFQVMGNKVSYQPNEEYSFHHSENLVSFNFSAPNFIGQSDVFYQYYLEGFEQDWNLISKVNQKTYKNLPPGEYTFKAKVSDRNTIFDKKADLTIPFKIRAPIYQRKWFSIACFFFIGLLSYLFYNWRINNILKKEEAKRKTDKMLAQLELKALRAQMNPHFMFNSLNSIKMHVLEKDKHITADYLTRFSRLLRQILNNSDKTVIDLSSELETIELYLYIEQKRYENFDFIINVSSHIDIKKTGITPMIIQPFIENAILHGISLKTNEKGLISITIDSETKSSFRIIIKDNGKGRAYAAQVQKKSYKSKGLDIIQNKMKLLSQIYGQEGRYSIDDIMNEKGVCVGTKVTLSLPKLPIANEEYI